MLSCQNSSFHHHGGGEEGANISQTVTDLSQQLEIEEQLSPVEEVSLRPRAGGWTNTTYQEVLVALL